MAGCGNEMEWAGICFGLLVLGDADMDACMHLRALGRPGEEEEEEKPIVAMGRLLKERKCCTHRSRR